jgi:hypothetical protein
MLAEQSYLGHSGTDVLIWRYDTPVLRQEVDACIIIKERET